MIELRTLSMVSVARFLTPNVTIWSLASGNASRSCSIGCYHIDHTGSVGQSSLTVERSCPSLQSSCRTLLAWGRQSSYAYVPTYSSCSTSNRFSVQPPTRMHGIELLLATVSLISCSLNRSPSHSFEWCHFANSLHFHERSAGVWSSALQHLFCVVLRM